MNSVNEGLVAVVTGGARGIGFAVCEALLNANYRVALADLDLTSALDAQNRLHLGGNRVKAFQVDVSSTESVTLMVGEVAAHFGGIDLLVNNAGIARQGASATFSDYDWEYVLNVHQSGSFKCSRASYEWLAKSSYPSIVNISSVAARFGLPGRLAYSVAKAGIESMTRVLAVEWAPDKIRVNSVAPGWTRTSIWEDAAKRGIVNEEKLTAAVPLQRLAEPFEIASAVLFLSSSAASYVTGQTLVVDGGVTIGLHL